MPWMTWRDIAWPLSASSWSLPRSCTSSPPSPHRRRILLNLNKENSFAMVNIYFSQINLFHKTAHFYLKSAVLWNCRIIDTETRKLSVASQKMKSELNWSYFQIHKLQKNVSWQKSLIFYPKNVSHSLSSESYIYYNLNKKSVCWNIWSLNDVLIQINY